MSGDSRASFEGAFDAAASKAGWRSGIAPEEAMQRWRYFTDDCLAGYPWEVEEYANDLTLRSTLQRVLTELTPAHPKCAGALLQDIKRIDSELMTVLSREVFTDFPEGEWWLRNAPQYGAHHFCEDFKRAYGVEIPVRSQYDNDVAAMLRLLESGSAMSSICIQVRHEEWWVARRPDLLFLACKRVFSPDRAQRRLIWSWTCGRVTDEELVTRL